MDKQMIEEMAKIIGWSCDKKSMDYCDKVDDCDECRAIDLYNAGYRKIPEGAVVLTGTETEQRFEALMVAFDEMGFMPNTTHPFPEEYVETWKQRLIFVFGQLRKETAEKFAERLKAIAGIEYCKNGIVETKRYLVDDDDIDEICKELIGGK